VVTREDPVDDEKTYSALQIGRFLYSRCACDTDAFEICLWVRGYTTSLVSSPEPVRWFHYEEIMRLRFPRVDRSKWAIDVVGSTRTRRRWITCRQRVALFLTGDYLKDGCTIDNRMKKGRAETGQ
jgi:hypothetical protein